MAKQIKGLDLAFLDSTVNIFLIREPAEMLTSVSGYVYPFARFLIHARAVGR